ncbi:Alcohol dehydrogenase GroES-like domain-containing protein isoform 2 [Cladophialophora immunda]|nr:Alcohol dehydrogenase GroES-like domain-containing protein isoform 2 [Cladophialophora immunda]
MRFTVFTCGVLYERFAPGGMAASQIGLRSNIGQEGDYLMDFRRRRAQVPYLNSAGQPATICMTSAADVARFVVAALDLPSWPREFRLRGERLSVRDVVAIAEEIQGRPFEVSGHTRSSLQDALTYARAVGDQARETRVHHLIATAEGRYDFVNTNLNQLVAVHPESFRDWLLRTRLDPTEGCPSSKDFRMKAVVIKGNDAYVDRDRPLPKLRDDYILVKTVAVALNPTDWKHAAFGLAADGCLSGCDFSGVVEEVGPAVTKSYTKGDRVAGVAHGGNAVQPEDGAFAEYVVAKGDIQLKIPDSLGFEAAATMPLGITTVMQGLYQKALKLNWPTDPIKEKTWILIYGGSTATGALGIQFAKLSGYTVITTCSPRNFDYVKSLGASSVFDYNDAQAPARIRELTANQLKLAWDTISEKPSAQFCADALSSDAGCKYGSILQVAPPRDDVEGVTTLMYTIFGEPFQFGPHEFPAVGEDFAYAKKFMAMVEGLLAEGKLRAHKDTVGQGGLDGVLKGMQDMKSGKVSGEKLVYRVAETP